jgi:hypothetical protein
MRFWTWKPLIAVLATVASVYLTVLGFQGRLPYFMAAFGWTLVGLNTLLDLGLQYVAYKEKEAKEAFDAALSAHFDRYAQDCCCEKDCSQCSPNEREGDKE